MPEADTQPTPAPRRFDLLTLAAVGTLAFIVQNVLHEGVGHAGACLLVGGDPLAVSTSYMDCDFTGLSTAGRKFVAAAGSLANLLTGVLFWFWLRKSENASGGFRLFLWLSAALGFLTGTGYLLFSGVIGVGDWAVVIQGFEPASFWRVILSLSGLILYLACVAFLLAGLAPMLDPTREDWLKIAFLLTFIPYLAGSTASTIGAFLNPLSPVLILTSAAAAFGGASGLAWMTQMYKTGAGSRLGATAKDGYPIRAIPRSWGWIAVGAALLIMHIFVLGPSIKV